MKHITVTFSDDQCSEIREIARKRQASKSEASTKVLSSRLSSGDDTHAAGYAAEYALALTLGVEPNREVYPDGTDGVTLRAHGATFNTKWVGKSWYGLRYWPGEVPRVGFMVVCDGSPPDVRLVGWVTRNQFKKRHEKKAPGSMGKRLIVEREDLNPMYDLFGVLDIAVPPPIARAKRRMVEEENQKETEKPNKTPEPETFPGLLDEETHNDPA